MVLSVVSGKTNDSKFIPYIMYVNYTGKVTIMNFTLFCVTVKDGGEDGFWFD